MTELFPSFNTETKDKGFFTVQGEDNPVHKFFGPKNGDDVKIDISKIIRSDEEKTKV